MTPACKFRDSFQAPEPLSQFWWYPVCLLTTGRSLRRGTRPSASLDRGIKPFYLVKLSSECVAIIAICSLSVHFNEPPHNARHAYNQTLPAVKTGQPLYCILTKIMFFVRITKQIEENYSDVTGISKYWLHCNWGWDSRGDGYFLSEVFSPSTPEESDNLIPFDGKPGQYRYELKQLTGIRPK